MKMAKVQQRRITNVDRLNAICKAARKAGMSYGTFINHTSPQELDKIVRDYLKEKKEG